MSKQKIERVLKKSVYDTKLGNCVLWSLIKDSIENRQNVLGELIDKSGKVAIVTGGSRGIGLSVVETLMKCGMTVVVGVRNTILANEIFAKNPKKNGEVVVFKLDLASMASVRKFAEKVSKEYPAVDLLVNNAGALFKDHQLTEDGFEYHFATNYLGHFLLSYLLIPQMKTAGDNSNSFTRIVNVSSCVYSTVKIFFDDIHFTKNHYVFSAAYAQSKLAQLLSTIYLNGRFESNNLKIRAYVIHPGVVQTDMVHAEAIRNYARMLPKRWLRSPEEGSTTILYACLSQEVENKGGIYIVNCKENKCSSYSRREDVQEKLFNLTCKMLEIETFYDM